MLKKIQRKKFLLKNPDFPRVNYQTDEFTYSESYDSYKLTLNSKSAKGHATRLSEQLPQLMGLLGLNKLRFLGDTNIQWLYRLGSHDYLSVQNALNYLVGNKISKSFSGAIELELVDLPAFIKHLFWLVRCNGVINNVYFDDESHRIMASICKYGNIHISILDSDTDVLFNEVIGKSEFKMIDHDCYDQFSRNRGIAGRIGTFVKN